VRDATKELEVMPTIPAAYSSELEALSHRDDFGSRGQSVNSLLEGLGASSGGLFGSAGGSPGLVPPLGLDPVGQQLRAAMARHAARRAR
jgi:hypothetical protein